MTDGDGKGETAGRSVRGRQAMRKSSTKREKPRIEKAASSAAVPLGRFELPSLAPEANALSTELQGHQSRIILPQFETRPVTESTKRLSPCVVANRRPRKISNFPRSALNLLREGNLLTTESTETLGVGGENYPRMNTNKPRMLEGECYA